MISWDSQDRLLLFMLFITENVVLLKMAHDATVDYMFHYFARNRGKGSRSVI